MQKTKNNSLIIILIVSLGCVIMGYVDAVIRPQYAMKSAIKILLFMILPFIYSFYDKQLKLKTLFIIDLKGLKKALIVGVSVFAIILGGYLGLGSFFDLSNITTSLTENIGVSADNFLWVAIYISFANSLLEEFFFRGFAFLTLKRFTSKNFAYIFSSLTFALYHVAMMIGWFDITVFTLSMVALFIGGLIFNYFNDKYENIYMSWLIHMFANFGTNAIGLMLFAISN